jgi:anthranilate/para-aminobenzoate synthase component II
MKSKFNREFTEGGLLKGNTHPTPTQYSLYIARLLKIALEFNDDGWHFPIWGICLGFESMMIALSDFELVLDTELENLTVNRNVNFIEGVQSLFDEVMTPKEFVNIETQELMFFNHHSGFRMEKVRKSEFIANNIDLLSTLITTRGDRVLGGYKHKRYPFYAVQYHPEANQFAWNEKRPFNKSEIGNDVARKHALVLRKLIGCPEFVMSQSEVLEAKMDVLFDPQAEDNNAKFYVLPSANNCESKI